MSVDITDCGSVLTVSVNATSIDRRPMNPFSVSVNASASGSADRRAA